MIVDYGLGNLFSLERAVQHLGFSCGISQDPGEIKNATRLLLPGVGAFGDGMRGLNEKGLVPVLGEWVRSGRPLLGICLGMQLLFSESEEFGRHRGLGWVPGRVVRFQNAEGGGFPAYKVPHVGWSGLEPAPLKDWSEGLLKGIPSGESAYFVHSYYACPEDPADVLAVTHYAQVDYCSAIQRGNVYGTQFHPEKSGSAGLRILKNFLEGP
ncbi:MAG: imidazole glycerol phosphate synthase subunit HisH [Candidatus Omnitrophica bacterium]|nr:imidazole glycerol phosphate synthase subunit HisH [Candidatus Omnitrophota bacterium]